MISKPRREKQESQNKDVENALLNQQEDRVGLRRFRLRTPSGEGPQHHVTHQDDDFRRYKRKWKGGDEQQQIARAPDFARTKRRGGSWRQRSLGGRAGSFGREILRFARHICVRWEGALPALEGQTPSGPARSEIMSRKISWRQPWA